jgi:hypothetical protein
MIHVKSELPPGAEGAVIQKRFDKNGLINVTHFYIPP